MRVLVLCLCIAATGCAGHRNCCLIAAAVGAGALVSVAGSALDTVIDPEPPVGTTEKSQREHFDWVQRQSDDSFNE